MINIIEGKKYTIEGINEILIPLKLYPSDPEVGFWIYGGEGTLRIHKSKLKKLKITEYVEPIKKEVIKYVFFKDENFDPDLAVDLISELNTDICIYNNIDEYKSNFNRHYPRIAKLTIKVEEIIT